MALFVEALIEELEHLRINTYTDPYGERDFTLIELQ